jgi:mono/diheme cytochrome c family protein
MRRKSIVIVAKIAVFVGGLAAALTAYASYQAARSREVPYPAVAAGTGAEAIARGAAIFRASCTSCHQAPGSPRAAGAPLSDAPPWIGSFHAANLTSHGAAGIGAVEDAVLARSIRYGVDREGRWMPMPSYALSDADLGAVLAFLRSDDALLRPDARKAPRSRLTLVGTLALFLGGMFTPPEPPARATPPRAPNADYGRYLAESVYQCGDCHTPGFDRDKVRGPDAYAGGFELKNAAGQTVYAPNLTRDRETGIGAWTRDEFARALREGVRPDGSRLGLPMPQFRAADELEVDALLVYLRSFPAQRRAIPRAAAAPGGALGSSATSAR